LIERLEDGSASELGAFQEDVISAFEDVCRNWLHYLLTYETEERPYRVKSGFVERVVRLAPAVLREFDAKFDVSIGNGGRLPRDPREAGEYLITLTDSMTAKSKPVRDAQLRMLDLPFADELSGVLDAAEKAMAEAAPAEEVPEDPAIAEGRKKAAGALADYPEGLATGETVPLPIRALAAAALQQAHETGVFDLSTVHAAMGVQTPQPAVQAPPDAGAPMDPTMGGAMPAEAAALLDGGLPSDTMIEASGMAPGAMTSPEGAPVWRQREGAGCESRGSRPARSAARGIGPGGAEAWRIGGRRPRWIR